MRNLSLNIKVIIFIIFLYSCGKSSTQSDNSSANIDLNAENNKADNISTVTTKEEMKKWPVNYLEIEGNDLMQYNLNELRAKAGKTITLVLKHVGKASKMDMGHNLVILKHGTDPEDFAKKALKERSHDYIPPSESKNIIAHTKLLGGGETDTITFIIKEKGKYDYLCSFPSHVFSMKGKLIIE